jgi:hypothetical protein
VLKGQYPTCFTESIHYSGSCTMVLPTERPKDVPSYFLTYNGRLGAEVLEAELQAVQQASTRRSDSDMAVASSSKDTQPGAPLRPASPVSVLDGAQVSKGKGNCFIACHLVPSSSRKHGTH